MLRVIAVRCWLLMLVAAVLAVPVSGASLAAAEKNAAEKTEVPADQQQLERLAAGISPLLSSLAGKESTFQLTGQIELPIEGSVQKVGLSIVRFDDESFDFEITHQDYAVQLRRRADVTAMALPRHAVVFLGRGDVAEADRLSPLNLSVRLTSRGSEVARLAPLMNALAAGDITTMLGGLLQTVKIGYLADSGQYLIDGGKALISLPEDGTIRCKAGDMNVVLTTRTTVGEVTAADAWPNMKVIEIPRDELERTLVRGIRRGTEIAQPSALLTKPDQKVRTVKNGRLVWVDGQRVALLRGTPEEIGTAHGQLLPEESRRCMESVLYTFGAVNTVRNGRWFRHDLEQAYARLAPHIPERHKAETRALAVALNMEPGMVETLNVFPELFHCSGFAVFGSATKDGRMYHGRVLDYMTTIGLQDAATTFVVQADGQIPFANVGYGGFIGSVSGMNAEAISLGEMGGRGEGQWDGVPMATLMRRAMEECRSLEEVKKLWAESPRTCEYYYVFADGKTNQAVGVSATPDAIEFIDPGQTHPQLGEGISDAVVLSAGSRLEELRRRVTEKHGQIDAETAMWLMSRPVAMKSNLHNVLFVPQDRVLYVANASHKKPAAETPYVRLDLMELLRSPVPFGNSTAQVP